MSTSFAVTVDLETTRDAFHRGAFHLLQPKSGAHRSGVDAMLLAACVEEAPKMYVADFGSGVGAVGLAVASRCKDAVVTLIESDPAMAHLAKRTLELTENARLAGRVSVLAADIAHLPTDKVAQNSVDWVVMNPPFNDPADRSTPHAARSTAHVMEPELFDMWLRKASTILHAKGRLALIARPYSLQDILRAADRRFGALRIIPVLPRADAEAIRVLVTGQKGSRQRLTIDAPIVLHPQEGKGFTSTAASLINGQATI